MTYGYKKKYTSDNFNNGECAGAQSVSFYASNIGNLKGGQCDALLKAMYCNTGSLKLKNAIPDHLQFVAKGNAGNAFGPTLNWRVLEDIMEKNDAKCLAFDQDLDEATLVTVSGETKVFDDVFNSINDQVGDL